MGYLIQFTEDMIQRFDAILKKCIENFDFINYERGEEHRKSLSNVELFAIFCTINKYKPDIFFESGIWKGRSTLILLECIKNLDLKTKYYAAAFPAYTNIFKIKKRYDNLDILECKGEVASKYIKNNKTVGCLIDAPKLRKEYKNTFRLYDNIFNNNESCFLFQHDLGLEIAFSRFKDYFKKISDKYEMFIMDENFDNSCRNKIEPLRKNTIAKTMGAFLKK